MQINRRKDPFRYALIPPLECLFEIIEINQQAVSSRKGKANIVNLSKSGCKMTTPLNLNTLNNYIKIAVSFMLEDRTVKLPPGTIKWQSNSTVSNFYGIHFDSNGKAADDISITLRLLASANRVKAL